MTHEKQRTSNELAEERTELAGNRTQLANERTELAVERTAMAANRTLMAWARTGVSLIGFGFSIYKILISAISDKQIVMAAHRPKSIGLFLIALGTVSVILGAVEYFQTLDRLDKLSPRSYKPINYALVVATALGTLGTFLFITILINKEVF